MPQMEICKWKELNIQWFSLWEKSSKTLYQLYLPNITQSYFVTHMITSNSMKWLSFLLPILDFTTFLPEVWNFLTWRFKLKCGLQRTCKAPEKTTFCSLMTIYHGKEITRINCYRTNSTDSRRKKIKSAKPLNFQLFCWSNYH